MYAKTTLSFNNISIKYNDLKSELRSHEQIRFLTKAGHECRRNLIQTNHPCRYIL